MAIAQLTKRLLEAGAPVDGLRMLKELAEREIRGAADAANERLLAEFALRVLYQRKAFMETVGMSEEHYPHGDPEHAGHGPGRHHCPEPKGKEKEKKSLRGAPEMP